MDIDSAGHPFDAAAIGFELTLSSSAKGTSRSTYEAKLTAAEQQGAVWKTQPIRSFPESLDWSAFAGASP